MARMGVFFEEEVQRRYPEFPTRTGEWSWEDYFPPMNSSLRQLVAAYVSRSSSSQITTCPLSETSSRSLRPPRNTVVLQEIREGQVTGVTGTELLELIRKARTFLASQSLKRGDRCGLLSANSIRWIAMDLAAMAEGLIVVPSIPPGSNRTSRDDER